MDYPYCKPYLNPQSDNAWGAGKLGIGFFWLGENLILPVKVGPGARAKEQRAQMSSGNRVPKHTSICKQNCNCGLEFFSFYCLTN